METCPYPEDFTFIDDTDSADDAGDNTPAATEQTVTVVETEPAADASERLIITHLISNPHDFVTVHATLTPEHFHHRGYRTIYEAMTECADASAHETPYTPADLYSVLSTSTDKVAGVPVATHALALGAEPSVGNVARLVERLRKRALQSDLAEHAAHLSALASSGDIDSIPATLSAMEAHLSADSAHLLSTLGDAIGDLDAKMRSEHGIVVPTGFESLDDTFLPGGLRGARLCTIGGSTGHGKSQMGINIARNAIAAGKKVLYVSLEMTNAQILARFTAPWSRIPTHVIDRADAHDPLSDRDAAAHTAGLSRLTSICNVNSMPWDDTFNHDKGALYFWGKEEATVEEIVATVRRLHRANGIDLVVIDHTLLINRSAHLPANTPLRTEVGHITMSLKKKVCNALGVPVILLHQVNREGTDFPRLKNLAESASVERDSDIIILLSRFPVPTEGIDGEMQMTNEFDMTRIRVDVAKNRDGMKGLVTMSTDNALCLYEDAVDCI